MANYRLQFRTSLRSADGETGNLLERVARAAAEAAAAVLVEGDTLGDHDVSVEYNVVLNDRTIPAVSRDDVKRVTNFRSRPVEVDPEDSSIESIPMTTVTDFDIFPTDSESFSFPDHTHDPGTGRARGSDGRFVDHDDHDHEEND